MKKSRLINIFKTLTKKEVRDLRKWLHSPAHNQREDTVLLFEYLVMEDNLQQESLLDKSTVFKYLLRDEKEFDDAKIRQVMYFLLKSTEEFLTYQAFLKDKTGQEILLARAFSEKKLEKYFQKNIQDSLRRQREGDLRDKEFYKNSYELLYENYQYLSKISRTVDFNLQEISDSLDIYFLSLKLRQCCIIASHRRVYKREYEIGLIDEILEYVERKNLALIPTIGIYYYGYKLISEGDDAYFSDFKKILFENANLFPKDELGEIYVIAINYRIQKINTGDYSVLSEAFELYKRGFETGALIIENQITDYTFNNVTLIALRIEKYEWAENFIENHHKYLKEKNRDSTIFYCRARLEYARGNYNAAMDWFIRVEHTDILLTLNAKTFLLKMYYGQNEIKVLDSLLDSMRTYLSRKKVVGYHKENYQNIIRYTKKLVRVNPFSKKDKEKLKNEIEKITPLTERIWLLEQISNV
ncbi:MAG: hypothetical protein ACI85O_001060 [Saprospiraceae bacterium]|jgi:hypothetical protein